ncbi:class I SAM-dependent methyltransferase [Hyphobacterium sp. HN65]|uniref:Class I SAM-dependent methyltransferase n=1 Tax=Hyphobacterium lacteum TaxID=3116575 RepID=A0ABU7LQM2_9PROT|nr:class I SAM-dependent methyltransferase [Hyphobacterium sp. HN65]MEE2526202.1 class I SAM-dependent methyltransferase [Hyphobacterium sp. HN65]
MTSTDRPLRQAIWSTAACDLCGCEALEVLGERHITVRGRSADFAMDFTDAACPQCGFVQALNRPDEAFLMDYYRDAHIGHRGGELHFNAEKRVATVASRVPAGGRIIEIGANDGAFCAELARAGFDAFGFDPVEADEAASVEKGFLEAGVASVAPKSADAVIAYYVLEHVINAGEWLRSALALLKDGGVLVLEVPDYSTHPQDSLNVEHLLHFTPESLRELLEQHGLSVEQAGDIGPTVAYGQAIVARLTDRALAETPRPASAGFLAGGAKRLAAARASYAEAKADRDRRQQAAEDAARLASEADPSGDASVFIWGANEYAERAAPLVAQAFAKTFVADKSPSKIGTPFPGLTAPIVHPDEAAQADQRIFLLCSPNWNAQIAAEISAAGWDALAVIDAVSGERLA